MKYWLLKSEPQVFGLDDLRAQPGGRDHWDGVRNYQARNYLREMRKGDLAFFYHSNCKTPAIVGIVEIVREGYPDHTAWDPASPYHDPGSTPDRPRWFMVDVRYRRRLKRPVTLAELKAAPGLGDLPLLKRGNRLSVMPVSASAWRAVLALEKRPAPAP